MGVVLLGLPPFLSSVSFAFFTQNEGGGVGLSTPPLDLPHLLLYLMQKLNVCHSPTYAWSPQLFFGMSLNALHKETAAHI